ncbi:helix-turn-helix domain-containing protein [Nocardia yunnanensis]|uniref:helix-turn-helix domain-containing protein n=1 Tax=Nocardia yunnanensis TaxID=2382165 RepID=UPI0013C4884F|nr:helix-turn-helix transcriptional regulator [Nocardia yunnanensis]
MSAHEARRKVSRRILRGFDPDRLGAAIEDTGLSVPTLARLADVSRQTLGNWISGTTSPSVDRLRQLLAVLAKEQRARGLPVTGVEDVYEFDREHPMLSDLRIRALLTQPELGKAAGLPTSVVQALEGGNARLMPHHIPKLAAALGVSAEQVEQAHHNTRYRDAGAPS